ncbi:MAG: hypothetical protein WBD55_12020 [Dehalococcoidia bacterium]
MGGSLEGSATGGGPASGPFAIGSLRTRAVDAAHAVGDSSLARQLEDVCCWAPAAAAIRERPQSVQWRGALQFFDGFPGGEQLAQVLYYTNNTSWSRPRFRYDPENLVQDHFSAMNKRWSGLRTEVIEPKNVNGHASQVKLDLALDRKTGEELAKVADRSEAMWAALSILSGTMLDPSDELSKRLQPTLSLAKSEDRALARLATVQYNQIIISAAQRAIWSDLLDNKNPALPLVRMSASGYMPLGERDGRFYIMRIGSGPFLTGYRSATA